MPTLLDLDDLPAEARSELQAYADGHGRSVRDEALGLLLASIRSHAAGRETATGDQPAEPVQRTPVFGEIIADAPNEEDTRMVDEYLRPRLEELRRQRAVPVQVRHVGPLKYQPCCESEEEAPE